MVCDESVLQASFHEFEAFKYWILLLEDEAKTTPTLHPLFVSLLKRFQHLFHEEIPSGLPPKRDIQHHINLILGAILPNKPTY